MAPTLLWIVYRSLVEWDGSWGIFSKGSQLRSTAGTGPRVEGPTVLGTRRYSFLLLAGFGLFGAFGRVR
jgi:hypothetical protein